MDTPVDKVIRFAREGYTDAQIIKKLREQGYTPKQINDAFNQAKVKLELNKEPEVPKPSYETPSIEEQEINEEKGEMEPSIISEGESYETTYGAPVPQTEETARGEYYPYQYPYARTSASEVEELVSEIVEEKWQEFRKRTAGLQDLKVETERALRDFEKKLTRFEATIKRLIERVQEKFLEHGHEIKMLRAEVYALKETLNKIMKPLMTQVKEKCGMLEAIPKKGAKEEIKKETKKERKKGKKRTIDSLFM
ncbi:MAG: hypothetical protein QXP53_01550 [Candidatus Pacearchaeota archaeon]